MANHHCGRITTCIQTKPGLTLKTILATSPDTRTSPMNWHKRDNERITTLRTCAPSTARSSDLSTNKEGINKENRCMCTLTNLSAAPLFDALYRKDVLSRGGYLHLDNRNSSAAFSPSAFGITLSVLSSRFSPLLLLWCVSQEQPPPPPSPNCVSSLAFAATPSAGELEKQSENTSRK